MLLVVRLKSLCSVKFTWSIANCKAWFPYMCWQDTQRRSMPFNVWTPMLTSNPSLRNKSLRVCNEVTRVELLREIVRPVLQYPVSVTYNGKHKKFFCFSKKRAKPTVKVLTVLPWRWSFYYDRKLGLFTTTFF